MKPALAHKPCHPEGGFRVGTRGTRNLALLFLTGKGKPEDGQGPAELRRGLGIDVEESESPPALYAELGYDVVRRYQKIREEWRLGSETICLDHTPIGDFVEFEGAKAEAVAKRCGFDLATSLRKSYLMLYEDYIAEHPDAPRDMIFRDNP